MSVLNKKTAAEISGMYAADKVLAKIKNNIRISEEKEDEASACWWWVAYNAIVTTSREKHNANEKSSG